MTVITIRGQLGSEAPEIGKACAEVLHINYVDREIITRIAEWLQCPRQEVIAKEILPITLTERIARAIKHDFTRIGYSVRTGPGRDNPFIDDIRYVKGLRSVIRELARSESVVIYGRGSQFLLKKHPDAFHILIVAPLETRIKRIMESLGLYEEAARRKIARSDNSRREFIKRYFKAKLEDPIHYDLIINTEHISFESVVSIIVGAASVKSKVVRSI